MELISYMQMKYGLLNFLEWLETWWYSEEWDFPNFMMTEIPKDLLEPYMQEGTYYRGIIVADDKIWTTEGSSWTPLVSVAEEFTEKDYTIQRLRDDGAEKVEGIVFRYTGKALNVSLILQNLHEILILLKEHNSMNKIETLKTVYNKESEFIAPFKIYECKIEERFEL